MSRFNRLTHRDVFDKTARLLSLPTSSEPNGLILERYASLPPLPPYDQAPLQALPKAVDDRTRLIFSLGGILSAVDRLVGRLRKDGGRSFGESAGESQIKEQVEGDDDGDRDRADRLAVNGNADGCLVTGDDSISSAGIGGESSAIPRGGKGTKPKADGGLSATPPATTTSAGNSTAPTAFDLTPELKPISEATKREVSRIFQEAVVEHVCRKVKDAIIAKGLNIGLDLDRSGPGGVGASRNAGVERRAQAETPSSTREIWTKDHDLARSELQGMTSARSQAERRVQLGGLVVSGGVASNQYLRKK
jgi:tRNA A37 threonylcarbamoyltransferase TsaD